MTIDEAATDASRDEIDTLRSEVQRVINETAADARAARKAKDLRAAKLLESAVAKLVRILRPKDDK